MDDLKGRTLGRYKLLEDIGQGGMSTVYRARDLDTKEEVAVKVLTPYVAQEPKFRTRFDREIKLLKDLEHENIVPVLDYGEEEGITYIVMPFYSGGTLQDRIGSGGMGLDEVGRFMAGVTAALEYAHERGIIHRDIKPSNILLDDDGHAMLSDFGFAYVSETSHSLTGSVLIGTPAFMSPEQCRGEEVDPRSDQYSLGAVIYQLTTGRLPYDGETPMSVVIKHISDPLPRPRYLNPHLPDILEAVILKAMAKEPEDRYDSISGMNVALTAAIEEAVDPETGVARPEYIGPAPATQVIEPEDRGFMALLSRNRVAAGVAVVALFFVPITAFALNGGLQGSSGDPVSSETPTPSGHLLATIDALSTANAEVLGDSEDPGAVETAVAATVEAMGLFDQPEATEVPTSSFSLTPTPSPTPSNTPWQQQFNPTQTPDDDPSGPMPSPTSISASASATPVREPSNTPVIPTETPIPAPTNTPLPAPTNTPVPPPPPTNTPVPPPEEPRECKDGVPPQNPHYCTPTPP